MTSGVTSEEVRIEMKDQFSAPASVEMKDASSSTNSSLNNSLTFPEHSMPDMSWSRQHNCCPVWYSPLRTMRESPPLGILYAVVMLGSAGYTLSVANQTTFVAWLFVLHPLRILFFLLPHWRNDFERHMEKWSGAFDPSNAKFKDQYFTIPFLFHRNYTTFHPLWYAHNSKTESIELISNLEFNKEILDSEQCTLPSNALQSILYTRGEDGKRLYNNLRNLVNEEFHNSLDVHPSHQCSPCCWLGLFMPLNTICGLYSRYMMKKGGYVHTYQCFFESVERINGYLSGQKAPFRVFMELQGYNGSEPQAPILTSPVEVGVTHKDDHKVGMLLHRYASIKKTKKVSMEEYNGDRPRLVVVFSKEDSPHLREFWGAQAQAVDKDFPRDKHRSKPEVETERKGNSCCDLCNMFFH